MVILFEGPDNVGKTTQINLLKQEFANKNITIHSLNYSGFKLDKQSCINYSKKIYTEMFSLFKNINMNFISDRSHLGEFVYGNIYRHYKANWIFDLEIKFQNPSIKLIVLIDTPENLIKRDDGLSFSINLQNKEIELKKFIEAFKKSNIKDKLLLNIENLSITDVQILINKFVFGGINE